MLKRVHQMKRRIVSCVWKGAQGLRVVPVVGPLGGRLAPGPWEPALGLQPPVVHFLLVPLFGPIKLYYLFEKIMKGTKISNNLFNNPINFISNTKYNFIKDVTRHAISDQREEREGRWTADRWSKGTKERNATVTPTQPKTTKKKFKSE
jgi:hypothetical protein